MKSSWKLVPLPYSKKMSPEESLDAFLSPDGEAKPSIEVVKIAAVNLVLYSKCMFCETKIHFNGKHQVACTNLECEATCYADSATTIKHYNLIVVKGGYESRL